MLNASSSKKLEILNPLRHVTPPPRRVSASPSRRSQGRIAASEASPCGAQLGRQAHATLCAPPQAGSRRGYGPCPATSAAPAPPRPAPSVDSATFVDAALHRPPFGTHPHTLLVTHPIRPRHPRRLRRRAVARAPPRRPPRAAASHDCAYATHAPRTAARHACAYAHLFRPPPAAAPPASRGSRAHSL
jgi:hypothetical protein